jgi:hypothetical protein
MTVADDPPAIIVTAPASKPADVVVVSRDTRSDILISVDTPLPLTKAGRSEDALFRQAISLTSTLTVVRPAAGTDEEVLRWSYEPYLQRQLCVTSITGEFTCTTPQFEDLKTETATGEIQITATPDQPTPASNPAADAARIAIATTLGARAMALFETDRQLKLTPMLKAAGVSIRRPQVSVSR